MPADTPKRTLRFASPADVVADVERLRRGHTQTGNWSLPQTCWHLNLPLERFLKPVEPGTTSTAEQLQAKAQRLDPMIASGVMPPGRPMPPNVDPLRDAPPNLDDSNVARFVANLRELEASKLSHVMFGPFGVIPMNDFRQFILLHAANHLSNLVPTT